MGIKYYFMLNTSIHHLLTALQTHFDSRDYVIFCTQYTHPGCQQPTEQTPPTKIHSTTTQKLVSSHVH
jgi:hypothetical protein